jgi:hypothetical protein
MTSRGLFKARATARNDVGQWRRAFCVSSLAAAMMPIASAKLVSIKVDVIGTGTSLPQVDWD